MAKSYIVGPGGSLSHNGKIIGPGSPVDEDIVKLLGPSLSEAFAAGTIIEATPAEPEIPPPPTRADLEKKAVALKLVKAEAVAKISDEALAALLKDKA